MPSQLGPERVAARIEVHGHCDLREEAIAERLETSRAVDLVDAPGDFVLVAREADSQTIVSSRSGVVNYFWARNATGRGISHGPDVATVLAEGGLGIEWNHRALADYLTFDHPLSSDTSQEAVSRVPAGAVLHVRSDTTEPQVDRPAPPEAAGHVGPDDAVEALRAAVRECDEPCTLSMSGGLDSRLLLAALLEAGIRPLLVLSGVAGSFDREVSMAVANRFELLLATTEVRPDQVADGAARIAGATNGLLPATNWAGLEHLRVLGGDARGPVLLGFNGELARSYYASDAGYRALREALLPRAKAPRLLLRYGVPVSVEEASSLHPGLAAALQPDAVHQRLATVTGSLEGRRALDLADEFFLTQYGRQKLSADLAAAGRFVPWRTPLFSDGWVRVVRALPRRWKLGDRLHRYSIGRLFRSLLDFPEEGHGSRTANPLPLRRMLAGPGQSDAPYYVDRRMYFGGPLLEEVERHRETLGDLVDPAFIDKLVGELRSGRGRSQLCYKLGALARWRAQVGVGPE